MCYYRLYIFLGCGHTATSSTPVRCCENATPPHQDKKNAANIELKSTSTGVALDLNAGSRPEWRSASRYPASTEGSKYGADEHNTSSTSEKETALQPCAEGRIHPLHTVKLERICADCAYEREERLQALEAITSEIRFDPARWQMKYRGSFVGPPPKRANVEGDRDPTITGEDAVGVVEGRKMDSGVWTMGAKWMKDWKGT
jgi:hypothetical protein